MMSEAERQAFKARSRLQESVEWVPLGWGVARVLCAVPGLLRLFDFGILTRATVKTACPYPYGTAIQEVRFANR